MRLSKRESITSPKQFSEIACQPTPSGILSGTPQITDTKKPNRINQLGYVDGGGGVRQREVANAGKVDLPAAQGIEQAFLVGEGAQRQGFLQASGQHVEIVGGEPLDTLPGEDHAERAIVVAQDADPQLGCLSQPRLLGLGPAGREDLGGVTAMEGQGQGRLQAQQAEQDQ